MQNANLDPNDDTIVVDWSKWQIYKTNWDIVICYTKQQRRAKMQYQQRQNDAAVVRRKQEQTRTLQLTIKWCSSSNMNAACCLKLKKTSPTSKQCSEIQIALTK